MAKDRSLSSQGIQSLIGDMSKPLWDDCLDQAFWAHDRGVDYPLTHYDEETWEAFLREGHPAARAVTNPGACCATSRTGGRGASWRSRRRTAGPA